MSAPDYGEAFALWRAGAGRAWQDYTCHAFVQGLGDGTLPRAAFLHYLRQDYVFLIHFSRAWALAAAKSETVEELRAASEAVHALATVEMPLHLRICAEVGLDAATIEATEEAAENLAYTRYVLEAGYSGGFLDLMAALAPCVLGYGEIGARLGAAPGHERGPYADWIATYAGEEYQALCRDVGALIDASLARRLGDAWADNPRFATLAARFATATRLEVGFWDMGLRPA
ncbi:thiaminase II [Alkalilacustris brevis]|uniref:thiaminase II n=1 Tax=Alkalilacustris brevis TaxID=2026338 RepID=UPI000E0D53AA|nr:thiaminase II [Alkalilacustris brevis]